MKEIKLKALFLSTIGNLCDQNNNKERTYIALHSIARKGNQAGQSRVTNDQIRQHTAPYS